MYIDSIIDDHVHKKKPETGPDDSDLVDELLALYSDDTEGSDLHNSIKCTRNNIKGIIMVSTN